MGNEGGGTERPGRGDEPAGDGVWLLVYFVHRYLDFRRPEFESAARACGWPGAVEWRLPPWVDADAPGADKSPLWLVRAPSEELAARVVRRAILAKALLCPWGHGADLASCCDAVRAALADDTTKQTLRVAHYTSAQRAFKVQVEAFGAKLSMEQQLVRVNAFSFVPFEGPVSMRAPDDIFWCVEVGGEGANASDERVKVPPGVVFARQVAVGPRQELLGKLDLKRRPYLGPTSMDHEMALIMANMGCCRPGTLTLDPFVGTGSVLVAAAALGAVCMGGDMDIRVVRDGKKGKNVFTNFEHYGMDAPCLLRADASAMPWRAGLRGVFDSIVCDPPYGIRAGGRKSGGRRYNQRPYEIPKEKRKDHIASTSPYSLGECIADLLDNAAAMLRPGGRLVYFLPAVIEAYSDDLLPLHPSLDVVANTEQNLTMSYQRRLVTMERKGEGAEGGAGAADAARAARARTIAAMQVLEDAAEAMLEGKLPSQTARRAGAGAARDESKRPHDVCAAATQ